MSKILFFMDGGLKFLNYLTFKFEPKDTDVYISTYPKAGTTLTQMMLYQMTSDGSMDFDHITDKIPWFEEAIAFNPAVIDELDSPRVFKTHLSYSLIPKKGKVIYVVRNVMDTYTSYYHHLLNEKIFAGMTREEFLTQFVKGKVPYGRWAKHLESWWPHRNDERVLFFTFEDLTQDMEASIRKIDAFLGLGLSDDKIKDVAEKCQIGFMKEHAMKFDPKMTVYRTQSQLQNKTGFIRKGKSGGWKESLSHKEIEALQAIKAKAIEIEGV